MGREGDRDGERMRERKGEREMGKEGRGRWGESRRDGLRGSERMPA